MNVHRYSLVLALAALGSLPGAVLAAVPSPSNSSVPACLATTPGGNIVTTIVVRDFANTPIANSTVVIDYNGCAGFVPCPTGSGPPDAYVVDPVGKTITMLSGPQGQALFYLRAGGGCSNAGIRVSADGVLLRVIPAASADQNGDLAVTAADVAIVQSKVGTSDLSGDINCDAVVNSTDVSIVQGYVGITCSNPTDVRPPSWGKLKTIYR